MRGPLSTSAQEISGSDNALKMYHDFTYEATLATSLRAQWKLDDVLRCDQELDFSCNFLPDGLAGTNSIEGLDPIARRTLNQIFAYEYLFFFGVFEEYLVPFAIAHAGEPTRGDKDTKERAMLNFAEEEEKHIRLFERYRVAFDRGFPVRCGLINSREVLTPAMNSAHPVAAALFALLFEWMTETHYVEAVRSEPPIEPLFRRLLKHHWIEEAQHAKLDTLVVDDLIAKSAPGDLQRVIEDFSRLFAFMNKGYQLQAGLNVASLEQVLGRRLANREQVIAQQHRAALWTFIGCGLTHPRVRATLRALSPVFAARVDRWTRRQFTQEIHRIEANGVPSDRRHSGMSRTVQ